MMRFSCSILKWTALVFLLAALLPACAAQPTPEPTGAPLAQRQATAGLPPQTTIDSPGNNSFLPLGDIEIISTSHGSNLYQVELKANGVIVNKAAQFTPGQESATVRHHWLPERADLYTLRVRAQNDAGVWGDYATINVAVGMASPTPTGEAQPTPVPAEITATLPMPPDPMATFTPAPPNQPAMPAANLLGNPPGKSTDLIFYGENGCGPKGVTVSQRVASDASYVAIFYHLQDKNSPQQTEWQSKNMLHGSLDTYSIMLLPEKEVPGGVQFNEAWLEYQIVQGSTSGVMLSSPIYRDIIIRACQQAESSPTPGPSRPTPTHKAPVIGPLPTIAPINTLQS